MTALTITELVFDVDVLSLSLNPGTYARIAFKISSIVFNIGPIIVDGDGDDIALTFSLEFSQTTDKMTPVLEKRLLVGN